MNDLTGSVRGDHWALMYVLLLISLFIQVHVKVSVPKGIKFVGHPGKHQLTRKKCVAPGEAASTSIVLSFTELGSANITGTNKGQSNQQLPYDALFSIVYCGRYLWKKKICILPQYF